MATSLQKQLSAIRQSRGIESTSKRLGTDSAKASFFFNTTDAALLTADDLYGLAIEGIDELSEFDGRFIDFKNTLFSIGTKDLHRELLTQEENEKLTIPIDNFFRLLSPYFLLQPAHKCIEYMIRRYKVHEFNIDSVMACVLPYHETTLFARLVQILNVSTTRWRFLSIIQDNGVPLPRETLIAKASRDLSLVSFVCDMAQRGLQENTASKTLLGFFGIFVSELFASTPSLSDNLIKTAFPYLFSALKPISIAVHHVSKMEDDDSEPEYEIKDSGEEIQEFRSAAFMAFTVAFSRTSLTKKFLDETVHLIVDVMTRRTSAMRVRRNLFTNALLCLAFMCQSQSVELLQPNHAEALFKHSHFLPALLSISETYDIKPFLKASFPSLLSNTVENFDEYEEIANYFLKELPLEPVIKSGVKQLLKLFIENKEKYQNSITNIMKIIDARYPEPLDQAIDESLNEAINKEERLKVLSFVQLVFKDTGHERLEGSGVSLFMALSHKQAKVRAVAMNRLSSIDMQSQENKKSLRRSLDIVFKRLSLGAEDKNPDLVQMTHDLLNFPSILQIFLPEQLFNLLSNIINHFTQVDMKTHKKGKLISVLISFLAEKFAQEYPEYFADIIPIVFRFLLIRRKFRPREYMHNILKAAESLNTPLFQFEGIVPPEEGKGNFSKEESDYNDKIAKRIGSNLSQHIDEYLDTVLNMLNSSQTWCIAAHILIYTLNSTSLEQNEKLRICSKLVEHTHYEESEKRRSKKLPKYAFDDNVHRVWAGDNHYNHVSYIFLSILKSLDKISVKEADVLNWVNNSSVKEKTVQATEKSTNLHRIKKISILQNIAKELFSVQGTVANIQNVVTAFFKHLGDASFPFLVLTVVLRQCSIPTLACVRMLLAAQAILKEQPASHYMRVSIYVLACLMSNNKSIAQCSLSLLNYIKENYSTEEPIHASFFKPIRGSNTSSKSVNSSDENICDNIHQMIVQLVDNLNDYKEIVPGIVSSKLRSIAQTNFRNKIEDVMRFVLQQTGKNPLITVHRYILAFFSEVHSPIKVIHSKPIIEGILERINQEEALSEDEAVVLSVVLQEFKKLSHKETSMHSLILRILDSTKRTVLSDNVREEAFIPAAKLASCLSEGKLFQQLNVKQQGKIVLKLARINGVHHEIGSAVQQLLENVYVSVKAILSAVEQSNDHNYLKETKSEPEQKKKVMLLQVDDSESPPEDLSSILNILIVILDKMSNIDLIIKPMFNILKSLQSESNVINITSSYKERVILTLSQVVQVLKETLSLCTQRQIDLKEYINTEYVHTTISILTSKEFSVAHNHALALITIISKVQPEAVVKNIAALLGSLGRSLYREDNYSFQIFQQAIDVIIPIAIENGISTPEIMRTFTNALPFTPSYRRIPFSHKLVNKMGPKDNLFGFILSTFNRFHAAVTHWLQPAEEGEEDKESKKNAKIAKSFEMEAGFIPTYFNHSLLLNQPVTIQISTMCKLLKCTTKKTIDETVTKMVSELNIDLNKIFYNIMLFIDEHLSKTEFLKGVLDARDTGVLVLPIYNFIETCLLALQNIDDDFAYEVVFEIIEKTIHLQTTKDFIETLKNILKHSEVSLRVMGFELLNSSITNRDKDIFKAKSTLLDIIPTIAEVIQGSETPKTKQNAIVSLSYLIETFGQKNSSNFEPAILSLERFFNSPSKHRFELVGAAAMCFGSACTSMKLKAVKYLPKFLPSIIGTLKSFLVLDQNPDKASEIPNLPKKVIPTNNAPHNLKQNISIGIHSLLSSIHAVIQSIPQLVSPYLVDLFALIYHPRMVQDKIASRHVKSMVATLALNLEPRLVFDPLFQAYSTTVLYGDESVCLLFENIAKLIQSLSTEDLDAYSTKILKFYLSTFDLRRVYSDKFNSVDSVEKSMIHSFLDYILRLNENRFKPMFLKLVDWSNENVESSEQGDVDRYIAFYRFVTMATQKLKTLFVPYYGYILGYCAQILRQFSGSQMSETANNNIKKRKHADMEYEEFPENKKHDALCQVLIALEECFRHDQEGIIASGSRFEIIMEPLVEQLENTTVGTPKQFWNRVESHVVPCIVRFAVTLGSDNFWKNLNYQVLQRMSSENVIVRYAALMCVEGFFTEIGEPFLTMLPETLSYLAEAMEDDDSRVQAITNRIMHKLEELSGEDIQSLLRDSE